MKEPDQIIFIENDEISMFLAENILSRVKPEKNVSYYSNAEKALEFIHTLKPLPDSCLTLFINAALLRRENDILKQIKSSLPLCTSRICLLTCLPDAFVREKDFITELEISCCIEKPLTEDKFFQALKFPS